MWMSFIAPGVALAGLALWILLLRTPRRFIGADPPEVREVSATATPSSAMPVPPPIAPPPAPYTFPSRAEMHAIEQRLTTAAREAAARRRSAKERAEAKRTARTSCHDDRCPARYRHPCHNLDCKQHVRKAQSV